jgi:hypothetical protein
MPNRLNYSVKRLGSHKKNRKVRKFRRKPFQTSPPSCIFKINPISIFSKIRESGVF